MTTITLDPVAFRAAFPQFADPAAFTDAWLDIQWGMAVGYIADSSYGRMPVATRTNALYLMLAHLLALNAALAATQYTGGGAVVTGATVGGVAITLAPPPGNSSWDYWLNQSPYGMQLLALLNVQSVGGFMVGGRPESLAFRKVGGLR